jgi:hypothetical protein
MNLNNWIYPPIGGELPKVKRIFVATPMAGGLATGHYVTSLLQNQLFLNKHDIEMGWHFITNESLIQRARNELVRIFLSTDCEYLMFIDSDIQFNEDAIHKLIKHNKDVVCAAYPKKLIYWDKIKKAALDGKDDISEYGSSFVFNALNNDNNVPYGLIEIKHGGTGFMLIKRQVFEKLIPFVPKYKMTGVFDPIHPTRSEWSHEFFSTKINNDILYSEDYYFCDLWSKHYGKIFLDTTIKLAHVGSHVFKGDMMLAGRHNT